jgi:hypothetical protein
MSDRFITRTEARDIAVEAAEEGSTTALKRTFALLGVDLDDFESVQEFRGDLQWVKSGRRVSKTFGSKAFSSIVGVGAVGFAIAAYNWARGFFVH